MIKKFKAWLKKREEEQRRSNYICGYDYAAGCLLRNEKSPAELEVEYITAATFYESRVHAAFDRGMEAAVDAFVSTGLIKDDRVQEAMCA